MCTATWLSRDGSFHLFFNRDELRSREPAAGPGLDDLDTVRFLAPRDGRAGGTWIAVTELGSAFALLNRSGETAGEHSGSRGRVIPRLVAAVNVDDFTARLLREPLRDLAPFRLAAYWADSKNAGVATWDGHRVRFDPLRSDGGLLASSGLGDEPARERRGRVWSGLRAESAASSADLHRRFHRSHEPAASAWSVCMHREDAQTVSYTEIEIDREASILRYLDGPPCSGGLPVELRLPRTSPARTR